MLLNTVVLLVRVMWDRLTLKELQDDTNLPPPLDELALKVATPTEGGGDGGEKEAGSSEMDVDREDGLQSRYMYNMHVLTAPTVYMYCMLIHCACTCTLE